MKIVRFRRSLFLLFFSLGCAGVTERKGLLSNAQEKAVSKDKYDELLKKYEKLLERNDKSQKRNTASTKKTSKVRKQNSNLVETVDIFADKKGDVNIKSTSTLLPNLQVSTEKNIDGDIQKIRKAIKLLDQKQYAQTIKILQPLESSVVRQIRVRALFYTGEALFKQKQYDLAMQTFEEILSTESFSGIILKTLRRLVTCSEKLKIQQKQEIYYSMLHDFFET